jgi:hypothetical protein
MRRFVSLVVLIAAFAAFVLFTSQGNEVLRAFGVPNPDCMKAHWLYQLGFNVPQCTCCSAPAPDYPSVPPTRQ